MKHKHSQNTQITLAGCHSSLLTLNLHNLRSFLLVSHHILTLASSHWPATTRFWQISRKWQLC